jgi:DNA-binding MarR family transcriptional regulator
VSTSEPIVHGAIIQELWVAARYGVALSEQALDGVGVDLREYGPLSFIANLQPVTRTTLARAMGLRRTTVRDAVGRLIERGHVEERRNPDDGRSTLLVLTPAGQEIVERGGPAFQSVLNGLDDALEGTLKEHEDAVRRVRIALRKLGSTRRATAPL